MHDPSIIHVLEMSTISSLPSLAWITHFVFRYDVLPTIFSFLSLIKLSPEAPNPDGVGYSAQSEHTNSLTDLHLLVQVVSNTCVYTCVNM